MNDTSKMVGRSTESEKMLAEYKGGHQSFPVAQDIVDEFVSSYKEDRADVMYSSRHEWHIGMTESEVSMLERQANKEKNRSYFESCIIFFFTKKNDGAIITSCYEPLAQQTDTPTVAALLAIFKLH